MQLTVDPGNACDDHRAAMPARAPLPSRDPVVVMSCVALPVHWVIADSRRGAALTIES